MPKPGRPKKGEVREVLVSVGARIPKSKRLKMEWLVVFLQAESLSALLAQMIDEAFDEASRVLGQDLTQVKPAEALSQVDQAQKLLEFLRQCRSGEPPSDADIIRLAHDLRQYLEDCDEMELFAVRDCLVRHLGAGRRGNGAESGVS